MADSRILELKMQKQELGEWCWAAVAASIIDFYQKNEFKTTKQCHVATTTFNTASPDRIDYAYKSDEIRSQLKTKPIQCCPPNDKSKCNHPYFVTDALKQYGYTTTTIKTEENANDSNNASQNNGIVDFETIKQEINGGRPLIVRITWSEGTVRYSHFLVISGYSKNSENHDSIHILNTASDTNDDVDWVYDDFKGGRLFSYPPPVKWTHTYLIPNQHNPKPPPPRITIVPDKPVPPITPEKKSEINQTVSSYIQEIAKITSEISNHYLEAEQKAQKILQSAITNESELREKMKQARAIVDDASKEVRKASRAFHTASLIYSHIFESQDIQEIKFFFEQLTKEKAIVELARNEIRKHVEKMAIFDL
ncbi:MAG: papain-like cysteine protease family protein [Crocosphaera sp.]